MSRVLFLVAAWTVVVVALGLRFFELDAFSLWVDETRSVADSETLGRALLSSYHPPSSYVLMWLSRQLFGEGNTALRAASALAGSAAVAATMALAFRLGAGRIGALAAGALLATAPAAVGLAREARMYGLLMLACTLALLALDAFARGPTRGRAVVAGVAAAFALSVHAYGVLFMAPAIAVALFVHRGRALPVLYAPFVVVIALLARIVLRPSDHLEEPLGYVARHVVDGGGVSPLTAAGRLFWYRAWAFELEDPFVVGGAALAIGALLCASFWWRAPIERARRAIALAPLLFAPLVIALLPLKSATRLFSPALPLAIAVAVAGVAALPSRAARVVAAIVLGALAASTLPLLADVYVLELEPWRSVCERVERAPGPVLISARYMAPAYRRCAPSFAGVTGMIVAYPDDHLDADQAVLGVAAADTVWLVASHTNRPSSGSVDGDADRAAAHALARTHVVVSSEVLSPLLRLERHVRRPLTRGDL